MKVQQSITPNMWLKAIFKTILMTSVVSGILYLTFGPQQESWLPWIFQAFIFGLSTCFVSGFIFMFYFDRYLIKHRPPEFYEKIIPEDSNFNINNPKN